MSYTRFTCQTILACTKIRQACAIASLFMCDASNRMLNSGIYGLVLFDLYVEVLLFTGLVLFVEALSSCGGITLLHV